MNPKKVTRFTQLTYDIPRDSVVRNPSNELWRRATRHQDSVWFVPDQNIVLLEPMTKRWREQDSRIRVSWFRFDERDHEAILADARQNLLAELVSRRKSLEDGIVEVRERIATAASGDPKALRKASQLGYQHVRRAKAFVECAEECAREFDLLVDFKPLFEGLTELARARGELYAGWVERRKENKPLDDALPTVEMFAPEAGREPVAVDVEKAAVAVVAETPDSFDVVINDDDIVDDVQPDAVATEQDMKQALDDEADAPSYDIF